jgi:hypothetical protein
MNTIKLFESKNIRSVWNEVDEKWYFSVQDVVSILTETVDAKDYIKIKSLALKEKQLKAAAALSSRSYKSNSRKCQKRFTAILIRDGYWNWQDAYRFSHSLETLPNSLDDNRRKETASKNPIPS